MKTQKPKIKFVGFKEIYTGGNCYGMEFAMPHTYRFQVTDDAQIPTGDEARIGLYEGASYLSGVSVDFKRHKLVIDEGCEEEIEAMLTKSGFDLYFWHEGHRVVGGVLINWKNKRIEARP